MLWPQVGVALTKVQVPAFQPKQGYSIPDSTTGESKPSAAATDDFEIIKSLTQKLQVSPLKFISQEETHQSHSSMMTCSRNPPSTQGT
jgi:hypothetical protein